MAKTIMLAGSTNSATSTANTTQFHPPVGNQVGGTVEADAQLIIRTAGTLNSLGVRISTNSVAGTTFFTFRKNGAAGNQTVSVGSTATGWFEDTTNSDTVVAGDLICIRSVPGATTNTFVLYQIKMEFDTTNSTGSTVSRMGAAQAGGNTGHTGALTTYYYALNASIPTGSTTNTNETNAQWKEQYAITYKNLGIKVSANSRSTASTVGFRKNAANGNQAATITANTTGWFEDTTNTDSVVANDLVNYSLTTGTGTSAQTLNYIAVESETTSDPGVGHLGAGYTTNIVIPTSTTTNCPITGRLATTLPESSSQTTVHDTYSFKGLAVGVSANTVSATSTVKLRVNGVDSALSASITSNTVGTFTDLTHTVTVADGDLVNLQIITGATGTSMTVPFINLYSEIAGVSTVITATPTSKTVTNKFITHYP
jgi:hypothetical protein